MIRSAVTVSLVEEARGGPFVFSGDLPAACRAAHRLGFDAIELFPPGPDAVAVEPLRTLLADHNLALAAVGTGAGWVKHRLHLARGDAADRRRARDFIRAIIEFGAALGAPAIIGSMQGRSGEGIGREAALNHLAEALEELGEFAHTLGVPLIYEPLNRYETDLVTTLGAGADLLGTLSTRNVLILSDLFHMNIEEVSIPSAILAGGGRIGHLHFVDSNRRAAGFGHLDYGPIAGALREIGYDGFASAEALPLPDPEGAAVQTIEAFRRCFGPGAA